MTLKRGLCTLRCHHTSCRACAACAIRFLRFALSSRPLLIFPAHPHAPELSVPFASRVTFILRQLVRCSLWADETCIEEEEEEEEEEEDDDDDDDDGSPERGDIIADIDGKGVMGRPIAKERQWLWSRGR